MLSWKIRQLKRNPTPINLERIKIYQEMKEPYRAGYNKIHREYMKKYRREQNGFNSIKNSM